MQPCAEQLCRFRAASKKRGTLGHLRRTFLIASRYILEQILPPQPKYPCQLNMLAGLFRRLSSKKGVCQPVGNRCLQTRPILRDQRPNGLATRADIGRASPAGDPAVATSRWRAAPKLKF